MSYDNASTREMEVFLELFLDKQINVSSPTLTVTQDGNEIEEKHCRKQKEPSKKHGASKKYNRSFVP